MSGIVVYGHGGSENHGNEAIVRGIHSIFPDYDILLYSLSEQVDRKFELDKICTIKPMTKKPAPFGVERIYRHILNKYFPTNKKRLGYLFSPLLENADREKIYVLEAGDQYCEPGLHAFYYAYINSELRKKGIKTVLLGCTINKSKITDEVVRDLNNYSLIITRESLTYRNIVNSGVNTKVLLAPDPAFSMIPKRCDLSEYPAFNNTEVIGINAGFLAQGNEKFEGDLIQNLRIAIEWILNNTDFSIALLPHVNWSYRNTDYNTLRDLLIDSKRMFIVEERRADEMKYIVSKCKLLVALRTHISISGISSCTPTILTGYKTKTLGICQDVFGDNYEKYFVDITQTREKDLVKNKIINFLENPEFDTSTIKKYILNIEIIKNAIEGLLHE